ncbi:MAG: hypothetical protein JKY28_05395 [Sulfurimonas sp.]|nr:hypothetical protein [Sulfurimonas sp.]PHQ90111.1 MAG: hypothetical protein COB42_05710 [Sulfurimonas sp.]
MKLILLQHLSGAKGTFAIGDIVTVDDATALRYIKKGIAKPKTEKELTVFMEKAQSIENEELKKQAQAKAILESDRFRVELNSLCSQVVIKAAEVNGKNLNSEEIVNGVESLLSLFLKENQKGDKEVGKSFFSTLFFAKK